MINKIQVLAEDLVKRFFGITVKRFEVLYPRRTPEGALLPPMRGRGFFPGADGLWKKDGDRSLLSLPDRPIIFVGQDFDSEMHEGEYNEWIDKGYQEEPAEGVGSHTWRGQLLRLDQADVARSICFHTNFFPGVRISDKNNGRSPAWADKPFVNRCFDFLDSQIRIIEPRAVIILGCEPTTEIFMRWLPGHPNFQSCIAVDDAGYACFPFERNGLLFKMAWMTHPCMGYANSGNRKYNGLTGVAAELAILRECAL